MIFFVRPESQEAGEHFRESVPAWGKKNNLVGNMAKV